MRQTEPPMRDLERSLSEQSEAMLQAYADAWHVDLSLAEGHLGQVKLLAEAMMDDVQRDVVTARLSQQAGMVLQEVLSRGGLAPSPHIASRYGAIRRFGPARLARERPWTDPANPAEEVYFSGLLFRGFDKVGGKHTQVLYVPEPLLSLLPRVPVASVLQVGTVESAVSTRNQGMACAEDVLALLARLRRAPVHADILQDEDRADLGLGKRWFGPHEPFRTNLIWRMVRRLGLVEVRDGRLVPTRGARAWLQTSDEQRQQSLMAAWRDDAGWSELRHQNGLFFEDTGWRDEPLVYRRNLLRFLDRCPKNKWMSLDQWVDVLREHEPGYMRPSGDMASWFIRDADTNEYLAGWESWPRIEGATARSMVLNELYWLGVVELGEDDRGMTLFRTLVEGNALLVEVDSSPAPQRLSTDTPSPIATIDSDMVIHVHRQESMLERYQIERFAEWQANEGTEQVFKITADSVWASQNAEIKIAQILSFMDRISGDGVPDNVRRALLAWGGRFGRVFVRQALVLRTVDAQTMRQLRGRADVAALLGEELSPTACLIDKQHVDELTDQLKRLGIWPHIRI